MSSVLRAQIITATLARIVINIPLRMVYPFLPEFSRGLGVPVSTLVLLISLRSAFTLLAPLLTWLPELFGRRYMMYAALIIFTLGTAIVVIYPTFPSMLLALGLGMLAKIIYDPALQSYFSDQAPYFRRGRMLAITELAWSLPMLVGMPLIGWLMSQSERTESAWIAPFAPLAILGAIGALTLWFVFPREAVVESGEPYLTARPGWKTIMSDKRVVGGLGVGVLIAAAIENLSVVYGIWLERSFGLTLAALGLASSVIGMAELMGEGGVMALADRLGKRRAVACGIVLSTVSYMALPVMSTTLLGALLALFIVFVTFEFTVVSLIPLMSELVPESRTKVMSANMAAHSAGRIIGAPIGGALLSGGIGSTCLVSAGLSGIAMVVLLLWVSEESSPTPRGII